MIKSKFWILFIVSLLLFSNSYSQNLNELRSLKEKLFADIKTANNMLKSAQKEKTLSLSKVTLLNVQIEKRKEVITNYKKQILIIESRIKSMDSTINNTEKKIVSIKKEYAKLVTEAYKRRKTYNQSVYFFSAESFNQAFQRYRMIQELNNYRKSQIRVLNSTYEALEKQKKELVEMKLVVNELLKDVNDQYSKLANERKIQEGNINYFKRRESRLRKEIKEKQTKQKDLENKIVELIKIAASSNKKIKKSNFNKYKGKLDWPVRKGLVVGKFGKHPHPVIKGLMVNNNGIDFQVDSEKDVYNIFDGEVSRVVGIPGYNKAIIVRHGKFLTVYANLKEVYVKSGTKVNEGSKIGSISDSKEDNSNILHFEIWEENKKINPSLWLKE